MTTKQHIFTGYGSPIENNVQPDGDCHHYIDTNVGDLWLRGKYGWVLIYSGQSAGNISFFSTESHGSVPSTAKHPAIRNIFGQFEIWDDGQWYKIETSLSDNNDN